MFLKSRKIVENSYGGVHLWVKFGIVGLQIHLEWTVLQIFFNNFAKIIKKFFFII